MASTRRSPNELCRQQKCRNPYRLSHMDRCAIQGWSWHQVAMLVAHVSAMVTVTLPYTDPKTSHRTDLWTTFTYLHRELLVFI